MAHKDIRGYDDFVFIDSNGTVYRKQDYDFYIVSDNKNELPFSNFFDYSIVNNGTVEELIEKVKKILIQEKIINND